MGSMGMKLSSTGSRPSIAAAVARSRGWAGSTRIGAGTVLPRPASRLLTELAARARVASITASSALEGAIVADRARARQIIEGRRPSSGTGVSRSSPATAQPWITSSPRTGDPSTSVSCCTCIVCSAQRHQPAGEVQGRRQPPGGLLAGRHDRGSFRPSPCPAHPGLLTGARRPAQRRGEPERTPCVLPIGLFVLDLLTIHPFADGNGRVVRAVTNSLLHDAGYRVSTCVSLEQVIANTADDHYIALLESTGGWHEQAHDPWPWLTYFVSTLTTA